MPKSLIVTSTEVVGIPLLDLSQNTVLIGRSALTSKMLH
jgi:hypothetical protein